jgi:CheY-like chemotaxis protein
MKPKVLLVDDDPEFCELIEFNLKRQGCDVLVAHEGTEALRVARLELPDIILLDVMLPGLNGVSVCEILQHQPSTRDIPVFILSALDPKYVGSKPNKARFAGFFKKPLDLKVLGEKILSAYVRRQAMLRSKLAHPA